MDAETAMAMIAVPTLIMAALLWALFFFYSVKRIEKGIVAEGKPKPCQWDPLGWRAFFYAWAVAIPERFISDGHNRVVNAGDVKRHTSRIDRLIAAAFMMCSYSVLAMIVIGWIFDLA